MRGDLRRLVRVARNEQEVHLESVFRRAFFVFFFEVIGVSRNDERESREAIKLGFAFE